MKSKEKGNSAYNTEFHVYCIITIVSFYLKYWTNLYLYKMVSPDW